MRKLLYLNNLDKLQNFGCRSTGNSLKNRLKFFFDIIEYDGIYSVLNSPGWDRFAIKPVKFGGIVPYTIWNGLWNSRYKNKDLYHKVRKIDALFGGKHDFIVNNNPEQSLINFYKIKNKFSELNNLYENILAADLVCINGEGTFLISNDCNRDASYYFFIILLCKKLNKKIYLLNCMIDKYAFEKITTTAIKFFINYLSMLDGILIRDYKSKFFLKENGIKNIEFCLDALFQWENLFDKFSLNKINKNPMGGEYILISGTSASGFYKENIVESYRNLINNIKKFGIPIVIIESCIGDKFLKSIADEEKLIYINIERNLTDLYQYICNSYIFISGRYHPTVVALSCGIPCISLKCNSNKMESLQKLINKEKFNIFSSAPTDSEIKDIVFNLNGFIENYSDISSGILNSIEHIKLESCNIISFLND